MSPTLLGTQKCLLVGGPLDGEEGELVGAPLTLAFPADSGGFVYTRDQVAPDAEQTYTYDPEVSPAHQLVIEADAQAVREVAAERGMSIPALLTDVAARRKARKEAGGSPTALLHAEAARLGITIEQLIDSGYDPVSGLYVTEGGTP